MKDFVSKLLNGNVLEAKEILQKKLDELADEKLTHRKAEIALSMFDVLDEANVVKTGRTKVIKVRFRRNAKGRIVVQRRKKLSAVKGYTTRGGKLVRMSPAERRNRKLAARKSKFKRRAKLRQSIRKRTMTMRRRSSMGL
jgi:hypothetical protein